ncbi:hypothetical protein V6N12_076096 [Hibiscus sabdariffa]|uniref:Uncharacterized protein n=1 Tax=Hibiscus sabdariffa TaxID=183260 RepID=A0ABR2AZX1_9ROSI
MILTRNFIREEEKSKGIDPLQELAHLKAEVKTAFLHQDLALKKVEDFASDVVSRNLSSVFSFRDPHLNRLVYAQPASPQESEPIMRVRSQCAPSQNRKMNKKNDQEGASSIRCLVAGVVHNQRGAATFALAAFPYVTLIVLCHLFFIYDVVVART